MKNLDKLIGTAFILLALPFFTQAAGIEVSPSRLEANINNTEDTKELTIVNPTPDVQVFDIFADDFTKNIKSSPTSFTLEAGGRRKVNITFSNKGLPKDAGISTFISVVSTPLAEGRLQARAGVKIPVAVTFQLSPWYKKIPSWAAISAGGLLLITLAFFAGNKFKKVM